jgi:hypothetical protein
LPNYIEISYEDDNQSYHLDSDIIELANRYAGIVSDRLREGDKRTIEFLFPHLVNVSWFTTDVRSYMPDVVLEKLS